MLAAVKAVKRLIGGKDDAAGLQQQIAALKREGSEASEEIERLKRERALAASFEEAEETDRAIARQMWITEHCAIALPELELRLAAVRAADQAAALARHKGILVALYPRLKQALFAAVEAQHEVMAAREAACREIGEAAVSRNLPNPAYAGFLMKDSTKFGAARTTAFLATSRANRSRPQCRRRCGPHCRRGSRRRQSR
jgi:hypothetical protein